MTKDNITPEIRRYVYNNILSGKMRKYISEDMLYFHFYGENTTSVLYFDVGDSMFKYKFNYRGIGEKINTTSPLKMKYKNDMERKHSFGWHQTSTNSVYQKVKEGKLKLLSEKI